MNEISCNLFWFNIALGYVNVPKHIIESLLSLYVFQLICRSEGPCQTASLNIYQSISKSCFVTISKPIDQDRDYGTAGDIRCICSTTLCNESTSHISTSTTLVPFIISTMTMLLFNTWVCGASLDTSHRDDRIWQKESFRQDFETMLMRLQWLQLSNDWFYLIRIHFSLFQMLFIYHQNFPYDYSGFRE